jgi:predicted anti-sigma-YlaC factor YlaD
MNCDQHQEEMSRMMDGQESGAVLPGLFRHLSECEECRRFYAAARAVERTPATPVVFPVRIDHAVYARVRRNPELPGPAFAGWWSGFFRRRIPVPAAAVVAVAVVMLAMGLYAVRGTGRYLPAEASVVFVPTLPEVRVEGEITQVSHE